MNATPVEAFPADTVSLVIGFILVAFAGIFGFLVKKAFSDLTEGVHGLGSKIDVLQQTLNKNTTDTAVLTARIESLEKWRDRQEKSA